jgi:2-polyprenyl-3-methyl-5-hydroxy-6-metoxy-1,4-benzoquinol methylase
MTKNFFDYRSWKGWTEDSFATLGSFDEVYFDAEFSGNPTNLAGAQILEMGFGNGNFLAYCRLKGAHAVGIEIDPDLVSRAKAAGFEAHIFSETTIQALGEDRFDAVVAFDVFEHIAFDELHGLITSLKEILRPGGILMARFPSGDSPFSGAMYNGDATHRSLIGSDKLVQLALASGLDVLQMRGARLPLSGLGLSTMIKRAGIVAVRKLIEAVLIPVYYNNVVRVIAPNAVCVLRKPGNET